MRWHQQHPSATAQVPGGQHSETIPDRYPSLWSILFVACLVVVLACSLVPGTERLLRDPDHGWVAIHEESGETLQVFQGELQYRPNRYLGAGGGFDAFVVLETRDRVWSVDYYDDNWPSLKPFMDRRVIIAGYQHVVQIWPRYGDKPVEYAWIDPVRIKLAPYFP